MKSKGTQIKNIFNYNSTSCSLVDWAVSVVASLTQRRVRAPLDACDVMRSLPLAIGGNGKLVDHGPRVYGAKAIQKLSLSLSSLSPCSVGCSHNLNSWDHRAHVKWAISVYSRGIGLVMGAKSIPKLSRRLGLNLNASWLVLYHAAFANQLVHSVLPTVGMNGLARIDCWNITRRILRNRKQGVEKVWAFCSDKN